MKRTMISTLLIAVLTVVGVGSTAALAQGKMVQAVPADTLFYFAGTQDSAFNELVAPLQRSALAGLLETFRQDATDADDYGQALPFLQGVVQAYSNQVKQDKFIPGVPEAAQVSAYTVGLVPVIRIQLDDADAFRQFLDQAEELGDASAGQDSFDDVTFRTYSIGPADEQVPAQLLVAVRPDYAVITLDAPMFREQVLPLALGLQAPATALPDNGDLQAIVAANDFNYQNLGFINQRAIAAALTGADDSVAGTMLDTLGADEGLAMLRNPACSADVRSLVDNWPVTALGVTDRAVQDNIGTVSERIVSRVTDPSLMQLLGKLRGHVPAALVAGEREPMFSLALALNMDELAATVMKLQERFIQADFQCPPLQMAQQQLQDNDPSAYLIPFSAMVKGVQGISLSVFNAKPEMADFGRDLDAMVVVSAEQPRMVFKMAKMFAPDAAKDAHLPDDGSPVELMPATDSQPAVNAMLAGQHLVLFAGPQALAAAPALKDDTLAANGILFARFDYGKLARLVQDVLPAASAMLDDDDGQDIVDEMQKQMQALQQLDMRIDALVDFAPPGVVVDLDGHIAVNDDTDAAAE